MRTPPIMACASRPMRARPALPSPSGERSTCAPSALATGLPPRRIADLIDELAQRQIPVELCITSNLRTGVCKTVAEHPTKNYFDQGVMITLNTDDPALFGTTLSREYQLAQETFGFTDEHLRELARNSFEASFLSGRKKAGASEPVRRRGGPVKGRNKKP